MNSRFVRIHDQPICTLIGKRSSMKFAKALKLTATHFGDAGLVVPSTAALAGSHASRCWVTAYYAFRGATFLTPAEIDFKTITHLIYFTIFPTPTGDLDPKNQGVKDSTAQALADAAHKAGRKVIICVGGDGAGPAFRSAIAAEQPRQLCQEHRRLGGVAPLRRRRYRLRADARDRWPRFRSFQ